MPREESFQLVIGDFVFEVEREWEGQTACYVMLTTRYAGRRLTDSLYDRALAVVEHKVLRDLTDNQDLSTPEYAAAIQEFLIAAQKFAGTGPA